MTLALQRVRRGLPPWPGWVVGVTVGWLTAHALSAYVNVVHDDGRAVLCLFKRITGVPCPTCGVTRGLLALADGDPVAALVCNPLVFVLLGLLAALLLLRVVGGRVLRLELGVSGRRAAYAAAAAALLANWVYVIRFVG